MQLIPIQNLPLIQPGDDLAALLSNALRVAGETLHHSDILVLAQKIISKAENRFITLSHVTPSPEALALAQTTGKDPRLVEVILWDSQAVIRAKRDVLIVEHRQGFISANAGIDHSNVAGEDVVLRLPRDADASARRLRNGLAQQIGTRPAIIIADSHGRPWRFGTVGVAIGLAGLKPVQTLIGRPDLFGERLEITEVGFADQVAAAASLVMGQAAEGIPAVIVRGLAFDADDETGVRQSLRPAKKDLFR